MIKYRQRAFALRERRSGYDITIVPVVIGAFGGGIKPVLRDVGRIFSECLRVELTVLYLSFAGM